MTDSDEALRSSLRAAQAKVERDLVPDFDNVWAKASARGGTVRRRQGVLAGSAVAAAVAVIAFSLLSSTTEDESRYVDADDLLDTTNWSAPSDSLLPEHQFDVYQDIPVLIESTDSYGGALL